MKIRHSMVGPAGSSRSAELGGRGRVPAVRRPRGDETRALMRHGARAEHACELERVHNCTF